MMTLSELLEKENFSTRNIVIVENASGDILTNNYNFYMPDYNENDDTLKDLEIADYDSKNDVVIIYVYTC